MINIRRAEPPDLEAVWALVRRAVARMNADGNPQWEADYPTPEHFEADLARGELFVAEGEQGAIWGAACINTDQAPEYASLPWSVSGPAVVLHRMAVDPTRQRRGVATAFFAFAEAWGRSRGIPAVHMDTYAQNASMQALVLGRGYVPVGEVRFGRPARPLAYPCFEKAL